jgi:DNA modification methylase
MNKILVGGALEQLHTLPAESVDMCITSPPYWGLRDYGVAGQLGLEKDFNEYIDKLCSIFDEVKRVLKPTGTCWVNLGDTYAGGQSGTGGDGKTSTLNCKRNTDKSFHKADKSHAHFGHKIKWSLPTKSLCQIPSRFAIEMCNRDWILRNEIIWHKPNCMPSSAKDRFTVDFEKLFFFTKNKKYYFEQQFEEMCMESLRRERRGNHKNKYSDDEHFPDGVHANTMSQPRVFRGYEGIDAEYNSRKGRNKRCVWRVTTKPYKEAHFAVYPEALIEAPINGGCPTNGIVLDPFIGSGTTAAVAKRLGRQYIGIELNPDYVPLIERRLESVQMYLL